MSAFRADGGVLELVLMGGVGVNLASGCVISPAVIQVS